MRNLGRMVRVMFRLFRGVTWVIIVRYIKLEKLVHESQMLQKNKIGQMCQRAPIG